MILLRSNWIQAGKERPQPHPHFIHETPTFMHHVGSTLGLMRFAMSAYKRGKVRQIFHFHKNCQAHTKVYILPLKTITHHQGLLCACALLLTKAGVAFITGKPGGGSLGVHFQCPVLEHIQPRTATSQDVMTVICGSSWFMIPLRSNPSLLHQKPQNRFCCQTLLYEKVISSAPRTGAALHHQHQAC